jgi:hypothetical protein
MTRTAVKNALALAMIAVVLLFSSCDLLNNLFGLKTKKQLLLEDLFGALAKADQEVQTYATGHAGALPTGFTVSDVGNVRTRTYTNYHNADGVIISGTDVITFNGTPGAIGVGIVGGNMDMNFSSISGGPYLLTLDMTFTTPPPTYTACTVNGADYLQDYLDMQHDMGPPGP